MKDFFITLLSSVCVIFISSMAVSFGNLIHAKVKQIKQNTDNKALKDLLDKFDYVVQICVDATNQTFVIDKKISSEFLDEDKEKAFEMTFKAIEDLLTDSDKQKIIDNYGDVSAFIRNSIEAYIKQSKD
jgi:glycyl-tRNA synthetase beta subunit